MPGEDPTLVGSFRIKELVSSSGDVRVYRARDEQVDRGVLLRVAGEASAGALLEDARRLAAVSHPTLVGVLGASRSETGGYAAAPEVDARPFSEVGSLSSAQAARVAIDIAGAIGALSEAGLRASIDPSTVLVAQNRDGVRGLLDPLRAIAPGQSCLAETDLRASTRELADLIEPVVPVPNQDLRRALAGVRSGVSSGPAELASALAPLAAPQRTAARGARRRPALVAAACLAVVAVGVAFVVHEHSGGTPHATAATRQALAARILARIPLGLGSKEVPFSPVIVGHTLWLATSADRLLRVDTASNQIVGTPIALGAQHPLSAVVASGGKLYTADYAGWLLRIDPRNGRITGRRHLGAHLTAIRASAGVLWVASDEGAKGIVLRVDPGTLRPIGAPMNAVAKPFHIEVQGSRAWVLGGAETGEVARVDAVSGERKIVYVGLDPQTTALDGSTLWITDRFIGTVSALGTERMAFTRQALLAPASAHGVLTVGSDVWVTASDGVAGNGRLRVERFDSRSGRHAGGAVVLGKSVDTGMTLGLGSLWVTTTTNLIRLAPAAPRPAPEPSARIGPSPHAFVPGPLGAGTWRARFVAPFTFSTPAFAWFGVSVAPDSVTLLAAGERYAELDIDAPRQVFASDGSVRDVRDPARLLKLLRQNARLIVGVVHHVVIGGRPALQFELRARRPVRHPEVCGPRPCVLLYSVRVYTSTLKSGDVGRFSLLRSAGRTIVIAEGGNGEDPAALATTAALLGTIRFTA
jgi:hypothetical protein